MNQLVQTIGILLGLLVSYSCASFSRVVRHGDSYAIINEQYKTYLTATQHSYRSDFGAYAGKVLTAGEWTSGANQMWDTIKYDDSKGNYFWVLAKFATLNEITTISNSETPIPSKNIIEFLPYTNTKNQTSYHMKSVHLGKCATSVGLDRIMSYEICDKEIPAQRWFLEKIYDEYDDEDDEVSGKLRAKVKFGCKLYG